MIQTHRIIGGHIFRGFLDRLWLVDWSREAWNGLIESQGTQDSRWLALNRPVLRSNGYVWVPYYAFIHRPSTGQRERSRGSRSRAVLRIQGQFTRR